MLDFRKSRDSTINFYKLPILIYLCILYQNIPTAYSTNFGAKITKRNHDLCPETSEEEHFHRIGHTRFFIFQKNNGSMRVTWEEAKGLCEEKGLKLAKIDDIPTSAYVSEQLQDFLKPLAWPENYYWMNAKYDEDKKVFIWQDTMEPIKFANFFFHSPRPKGFGDNFLKNGIVEEPPPRKKEACLMLSVPHPLEKNYDPKVLAKYGMATSWWERPCNLIMKANVLCESQDTHCDATQNDSAFTNPETTYYRGWWPMSNRKFVTSWDPMTLSEAKQSCEDFGMKLYEPSEADEECLPEYLKHWMREVTTYSFWTGVTFDNIEKRYLGSDGKVTEVFTPTETRYHLPIKIEKNKTLDSKMPTIPVSLTWNNEIPPWNQNFCNCTVQIAVLSPENANDPIGTICQTIPSDDTDDEDCDQKFIGPPLDPGEHHEDLPKFKEYYSFNEDEEFMRSAYKQPGTASACPDGYRRAKKDVNYWGDDEAYANSKYKYDFTSPYWMAPTKKDNIATCYYSLLSVEPGTNKLKQTLKEEKCTALWAFVLCQRTDPKNNEEEEEQETEDV